MSDGNHEIRAHSVVGASGAHRWMNCTGSVSLVQHAPKEKFSPYAAEGTKAHEMCEALLKWQTIEPETPEEQEMLSHAEGYVAFVRDKLKEYGATRCEIEETFSVNKELNMYGSCDFCAVCEKDGVRRLLVIDYKYGKGYAPDAVDNPQLAFYAVAALMSIVPDKDIDECLCYIYQPRATHMLGIAREWRMSLNDLRDWYKLFTSKAREALDQIGKPIEELKLTPSEGACRFCPAKTIINEDQSISCCPALEKKALSVFKKVEEAPKEILKLAETDVEQLLDKWPLIKKFMADLEEAVIQAATNDYGGTFANYKVVRGRANRKFNKADEKIIEELIARGLNKDEFIREKPIALSKIERLAKSQGVSIEDLIFKPPGKLKLIRAEEIGQVVRSDEQKLSVFKPIDK